MLHPIPSFEIWRHFFLRSHESTHRAVTTRHTSALCTTASSSTGDSHSFEYGHPAPTVGSVNESTEDEEIASADLVRPSCRPGMRITDIIIRGSEHGQVTRQQIK
jgi:hypothetical protein